MQLPWANALFIGDPGVPRKSTAMGWIGRLTPPVRAPCRSSWPRWDAPWRQQPTVQSEKSWLGRPVHGQTKIEFRSLYRSMSLIGPKPGHHGKNEQPFRPSVLLPPHDWRPETLSKNLVSKSLEESEAKRRILSRQMRLITVSWRKASRSVVARIFKLRQLAC
jgi:hypothetical protein